MGAWDGVHVWSQQRMISISWWLAAGQALHQSSAQPDKVNANQWLTELACGDKTDLKVRLGLSRVSRLSWPAPRQPPPGAPRLVGKYGNHILILSQRIDNIQEALKWSFNVFKLNFECPTDHKLSQAVALMVVCPLYPNIPCPMHRAWPGLISERQTH